MPSQNTFADRDQINVPKQSSQTHPLTKGTKFLLLPRISPGSNRGVLQRIPKSDFV